MKPVILQIAIATPLPTLFDYLAPENCPATLQPGSRVKVSFRGKETIGLFVHQATHTDVPKEKLKQAIEILDDEPILSPEILSLCSWAADYYHHPIGEVFANALPAYVRANKQCEIPSWQSNSISPTESPLALNEDQALALSSVIEQHDTFKPFLLEGVTGSGKTEVYLKTIEATLLRNKQILVLVPEISLTPQMITRFTDRLPVPIALCHSGLTQKQRYLTWHYAKSGIAKIVLGTRSAVFTPFVDLGLIIIDEEHDASFKQQEGFRYHARDIAVVRASRAKIPIIMGSATPALETLYNSQRAKYQHLRLPSRAGNAAPPEMKLIDCRGIKLDDCLSPQLIQTMREHLTRGEQVMLFLNRRGFAPTLFCRACGFIATCFRCDARMTIHKQPYCLRCHHCGSEARVPEYCDECQLPELTTLGKGTERIEETLSKLFPNHNIARIDRDSTRKKGALETLFSEIESGEKHILIGTQMLAKGHHFPKVTLVGIVDTDGGLFSVDFRAPERTAQLITQVAGRAGRAEHPGTVMLQTYHPDHPLLQRIIAGDYPGFVKMSLQERQKAHLPPYSHLALFRSESVKPGLALDFLEQVYRRFQPLGDTKISITRPMPAPMEKRAGRFRAQLLIGSSQRQGLHRLVSEMLSVIRDSKLSRKVRWSVDIDPIDLM